MRLEFKYLFHDISPDPAHEPVWAPEIKRWSQLDKESFVMAEATARSLKFLGNPEQVILLSSQGSTPTDFLFAHSNKLSPSYFVHTLPNVRSLVFSKLSGWEGAMFCFSQGKHSLVRFLNEVLLAHSQVKTLIINLNHLEGIYHCDFYQVGTHVDGATHVLEGEANMDKYLMDDFMLRDMITKKETIELKNGLTIRKIS
jgi:hypothetical protein